jgi:hypothetical protein
MLSCEYLLCKDNTVVMLIFSRLCVVYLFTTVCEHILLGYYAKRESMLITPFLSGRPFAVVDGYYSTVSAVHF